jgi:hypothetical protein
MPRAFKAKAIWAMIPDPSPPQPVREKKSRRHVEAYQNGKNPGEVCAEGFTEASENSH